MNMLYFSVHQILEDDEVRLFKRLGYNVFCLGVNGKRGAAETFRPAIQFSEKEISLYDVFEEYGGYYFYGQDTNSIVIPKAFLDLIDVIIVMHNPDFIIRFWGQIRHKTVIWRAIGQDIDGLDRLLLPYRKQGLWIVRYSPLETTSLTTIGQDALIRFGKSSEDYGKWIGDNNKILTFSNSYQSRYPLEYSDYCYITEGLPRVLGGVGNEGLEGAVGAVSWTEQLTLLRDCSVYFYASGTHIPYTLNFIEAWITGIPVVVYSPSARQDIYFEIDRLIDDGVNGFVCRSVDEARRRLVELLDDASLRKRIGDAGRAKAMSLFDEREIERNWSAFFSTLNLTSTAIPVPTKRSGLPEKVGDMKNLSKRIFNTLTLMKPFDIDRDKIYLGNERDGGYVMADVPSTGDIISFGVGTDVSFEFALAERGHRAFLHDHTVGGVPQEHRRFTFSQTGICGTPGQGGPLKTLDETLAAIADLSAHLMLKMDVEGSEWDVFSTISQQTLERFDQILVEVHWLENLAETAFEEKVRKSFVNLNKQFTLFHVHANNCAELHIIGGLTVASVLEMSFIRTTLVHRRPSRTVYPSLLNKSNHPDFTDHALLFYPFIPSAVETHQISEVVCRIDLQHKIPD